MVGCDGVYECCDVTAWSGASAASDCANCAQRGRQLFEVFGLPVVQIRSLLTATDFEETERWVQGLDPANYQFASFDDLPIGSWVTSSVFSYFRITHSELDKPRVRAVHRQFLKNGLLTVKAISRQIASFRPTSLCVYNARFAPYSVVFEVGRRLGLPVITHERGMADGTFVLYENASAIQTGPVFDCSATWRNVPLIEPELRRAKEYFVNRERGTDSNWAPYFETRTDFAEVRSKLGVPEGARLCGVFTSSEYEIAYCKDLQSFISQLDFIDRLIEVFRKRDDFLVIRHHPLIGGDERSNPDWAFLSRAYKQAFNAPPNVRVIMPHEKFNSYELLANIDVGMAFISTIGAEAVARGVPMACFRESPYRDSMPEVVVGSDEHYISGLLDRLYGLTQNFGAADLRRCYRYIHSYITKLSVTFRSFGISKIYGADIRIKSLEDLLPGVDPTLDRVCDRFLRGASLLEMPSSEHSARGLGDEDRFFAEELKLLSSFRGEVRDQSGRFASSRPPRTVAVVFTNTQPSGECRLSLERSRHKALSYHSLAKESEQELGTLTALALLLDEIHEEFVIVCDGAVRYDESFVASALERLSGQPGAFAVRYGLWLQERDGLVSGDAFSSRVPARTYEEALRAAPMLQDPKRLLSLCLWRREGLRDVLRAIEQGAAGMFGPALFGVLQGEATERIDVPMVIAERDGWTEQVQAMR